MSLERVYRLRITSPDEPERLFSLDKDVIRIGRDARNDLVLAHGWVSRSHARLFCDREPIRIQDLGSSNGTAVNDAPLPPQQVRPLAEGDVIAIGPFRLRLETVSAADQPVEPRPERAFAGLAGRPAPRAAAPPPSPPETPTQAGSMPPTPWVGMPSDGSRWLQYLPPIYAEHEFLGRFLSIFEDMLGPIQQNIYHFDLYLSPKTAPESFLPWLNDWLGSVVDERWPMQVWRKLLEHAAWLYQARGTKSGLARHIELATGLEPEIIENADGPYTVTISLRAEGRELDQRLVERIVQFHCPAHVSYRLQIRS